MHPLVAVATGRFDRVAAAVVRGAAAPDAARSTPVRGS
jgi:hypothetical protein